MLTTDNGLYSYTVDYVVVVHSTIGYAQQQLSCFCARYFSVQY